jgi:hypothetical protein
VTVFERVAAADGDTKGLFSAEALAGYAQVLGREVRADEVQAVLNELMVATLLIGITPIVVLLAFFWVN